MLYYQVKPEADQTRAHIRYLHNTIMIPARYLEKLNLPPNKTRPTMTKNQIFAVLVEVSAAVSVLLISLIANI